MKNFPSIKSSPYPLVDALLNGRSRRFAKGAAMPDGALGYISQKSPAKLTLKEEALMAFAASGITGPSLADLPFHRGAGGEGNVMLQTIGRTMASGDSGQFVVVFVMNDEGVWMLKRPQDFINANKGDELREILKLTQEKKWVKAYQKMRVKVKDGRSFLSELNGKIIPPFNNWSANKPGSTYFIPVIDYLSMYLNGVITTMSKGQGYWIADDFKEFAPAGDLFKYIYNEQTNPNGHLKAENIVTLTQLDLVIDRIVSVELGGVLQNLRLMSQALGLGGFPHHGGIPGTWEEILGFSKTDRPDPFPDIYHGLQVNGQTLLDSYIPPYYPSVRAAVEKFVERKFGAKGSLKDPKNISAWKNPAQVKEKISPYTKEQVEAAISHIEYLLTTYGKAPYGVNPLQALFVYQAHVLDTDFYKTYYKKGSLTKEHHCRSSK